MTDRFVGEYQDVPVVTYCCRCEEPIYEGDLFADTNYGDVCEGCASEVDYKLGAKRIAGMSDGMNWDKPNKK